MIDNRPLAERMRPTHINNYVGQKHLLGEGKPIYSAIKNKSIPSMILWGPPGVGKTTIAEIISRSVEADFFVLSAINSGVKDVREIITRAENMMDDMFTKRCRPILFIDEIHRFSKNQQDALLPCVEKGLVTLIGATTENPSFEVIRPLLSRCQVYKLEPLSKDDLLILIERALNTDSIFSNRTIKIVELDSIIHFSAGDARKVFNILELVANTTISSEINITNQLISSLIQENTLAFDKGGEMHYDLASALIKSIRGSDPDASIYYLARLLVSGEDPSFIARRLVISAAEDIGLANPNALLLAEATAQATERLGMPECRIPLAETTIYLATSPKSNSAYMAINKAMELVNNTGNLSIPLHIRNAVTDLMKDFHYGKGYLYPHDYPGHFIKQQYLPKEIEDMVFYNPSTDNNTEKQIIERQKIRWKDKHE